MSEFASRDPNKPTMLFISPTLPSRIGNGSAIRAEMELRVFSELFNIELFVFHIYQEIRFRGELVELSDLCTSVTVLPKTISPREVNNAIDEISSGTWDAIHIFRLKMLPFVYPILDRAVHRPYMTLDLDDYESKKELRLALHFESQGNLKNAELFRESALRLSQLEHRILPKFDKVYVSNPDDKKEIESSGCRDVVVLPNAVVLPFVSRESSRVGEARMLFVGTMQYYPNEDASIYFCEHILPLIRNNIGRQFTVTIVGTRPSERVKRLCVHPEVTVTGDVPSLAEYYNKATLAIVPIRIGGGTRIKILEACSYQVPVVSTILGAEGLNVSNGQELLIGNTPTEFAEHCILLVKDATLSRRIAHNGWEWVRRFHTLGNVRSVIRETLGRSNTMEQRFRNLN